jgi:ketosteroid isomerase-like protein
MTEATRAEAVVRRRLANYASAAAAVDAATSASFFAPRGVLFEPGIPPIVSPDSIRAFIASFPGVTVDSSMLRADTVEVYGSTALVWGTYFERLRFPGQPVSAQYGRFVMNWRRDPNGVWLIARYYRVPLPEGWRDTL